MSKRTWILVVLLVVATVRVHEWFAEREATLALCAEIASGEGYFQGSLFRLPTGFWELSDPQWGRSYAPRIPFSGQVWLEKEALPKGPAFGRQIEIRGHFHCQVLRRNPGRVQDGFADWEMPRIMSSRFRTRLLPDSPSWDSILQVFFEHWLAKTFATAPGWLGVERTVWLGDTSGLPTELRDFYREGGLYHVLALGGQRVHALVLVLLILLRGFLFWALRFGFWRFANRGFRFLHRALPMLCCLFLYLINHQGGALKRVLAMTLAIFGLRTRRVETSSLQIATSSAACLILWDPSLLGQTGFFLSAAATAVLCQVVQEVSVRRAWGTYLTISAVMPVLVFPFSAFFFAKVSWMAPLHGLVIGSLWMGVLTPMAFMLPLVCVWLPVSWAQAVGSFVEQGWWRVVHLNLFWSHHVATGLVSVVRPTWVELGLGEGLLVLVVVGLLGAFFPSGRPDDLK